MTDYSNLSDEDIASITGLQMPNVPAKQDPVADATPMRREQAGPEDELQAMQRENPELNAQSAPVDPVKDGFRTFFSSFFGQGRKDAMADYRAQTRTGDGVDKTLGYLSDLGNSFYAGLIGGGTKMAEAAGHVFGNEGLVQGARDFQRQTEEYLPSDMIDTAEVDENGQPRERTWGQRVLGEGKNVARMLGEFAPAAGTGPAGVAIGKAFTFANIASGGINRYNQIVDSVMENAETNGMSKSQARLLGAAGGAIDAFSNAFLMGKFTKGGAKPISDKFFQTFVKRTIAGAAKTGGVMGVSGGAQSTIDQLAQRGDFDIEATGNAVVDGVIQGAMFHVMNDALHAPVTWSQYKGISAARRQQEQRTAADAEETATAGQIAAEATELNREVDEANAAMRSAIDAQRMVLNSAEGIAAFSKTNPDLVVEMLAARGRVEDVPMELVSGLGDLSLAFQNQADVNHFADRLAEYRDYANYQAEQDQRAKWDENLAKAKADKEEAKAKRDAGVDEEGVREAFRLDPEEQRLRADERRREQLWDKRLQDIAERKMARANEGERERREDDIRAAFDEGEAEELANLEVKRDGRELAKAQDEGLREEAEREAMDAERAKAEDASAAEDADMRADDAIAAFREAHGIEPYETWLKGRNDTKVMRWMYNKSFEKAVRKAVGMKDELAQRIDREVLKNMKKGEFDFTYDAPKAEAQKAEPAKAVEAKSEPVREAEQKPEVAAEPKAEPQNADDRAALRDRLRGDPVLNRINEEYRKAKTDAERQALQDRFSERIDELRNKQAEDTAQNVEKRPVEASQKTETTTSPDAETSGNGGISTENGAVEAKSAETAQSKAYKILKDLQRIASDDNILPKVSDAKLIETLNDPRAKDPKYADIIAKVKAELERRSGINVNAETKPVKRDDEVVAEKPSEKAADKPVEGPMSDKGFVNWLGGLKLKDSEVQQSYDMFRREVERGKVDAKTGRRIEAKNETPRQKTAPAEKLEVEEAKPAKPAVKEVAEIKTEKAKPSTELKELGKKAIEAQKALKSYAGASDETLRKYVKQWRARGGENGAKMADAAETLMAYRAASYGAQKAENAKELKAREAEPAKTEQKNLVKPPKSSSVKADSASKQAAYTPKPNAKKAAEVVKDFVVTDKDDVKLRPHLANAYHDKDAGRVVATDGRYLIATKHGFDPNAKEPDHYADWRQVIPDEKSMTNRIKVNPDDLANIAKKAARLDKALGGKIGGVIVFNIGDGAVRLNAKRMATVAKAMSANGIDEIMTGGMFRPIMAKNGDTTIVLMPLRSNGVETVGREGDGQVVVDGITGKIISAPARSGSQMKSRNHLDALKKDYAAYRARNLKDASKYDLYNAVVKARKNGEKDMKKIYESTVHRPFDDLRQELKDEFAKWVNAESDKKTAELVAEYSMDIDNNPINKKYYIREIEKLEKYLAVEDEVDSIMMDEAEAKKVLGSSIRESRTVEAAAKDDDGLVAKVGERLSRLVPGTSFRIGDTKSGNSEYYVGTGEVVMPKGKPFSDAVHEVAGHGMYAWAKKNAPEQFRKMLEYVRTAPKDIKDYVYDNYRDFSPEALVDEIFAHRFAKENGEGFRRLVGENLENRHWWTNVMHTLRNVFTDAAKRNGVDVSSLKGLDAESFMRGVAEQMALGKTLNEYTAFGDDAKYLPGFGNGGGGDGKRYSISNIYTGSAADYATKGGDGRITNSPSLKHVGTGEGNQVYGWGLYGSSERGVAEHYASNDVMDKGLNRLVSVDGKFEQDFKSSDPERYAISMVVSNNGNLEKAAQSLRKIADATKLNKEEYRKTLNDAASMIENGRVKVDSKFSNSGNIYEQTFFTNRAKGDESHLLSWYEPVSEENWKRIEDAAEREFESGAINVDKEDISNIRANIENRGKNQSRFLYEALTDRSMFGSPKAASEFLARADIDGIKYPVDSYGGKSVKDGDAAGWNYVSFRDDNIRVDHKWVDGEKRYSRGPYDEGTEDGRRFNEKYGDAERDEDANGVKSVGDVGERLLREYNRGGDVMRYARNNGMYLGKTDESSKEMARDKFQDGETDKHGMETTHVVRDGDTVYKYRLPTSTLAAEAVKADRHNQLFGDRTPYRVAGMSDDGGRGSVVLSQPYVEFRPGSGEEARRQLLADMKERFGDAELRENELHAGGWVIDDLKDDNIGIDAKTGTYAVIDAIVKRADELPPHLRWDVDNADGKRYSRKARQGDIIESNIRGMLKNPKLYRENRDKYRFAYSAEKNEIAFFRDNGDLTFDIIVRRPLTESGIRETEDYARQFISEENRPFIDRGLQEIRDELRSHLLRRGGSIEDGQTEGGDGSLGIGQLGDGPRGDSVEGIGNGAGREGEGISASTGSVKEGTRESRLPANQMPGHAAKFMADRETKGETYMKNVADRYYPAKSLIRDVMMAGGMSREKANEYAENDANSFYHAKRVQSGKAEKDIVRVKAVQSQLEKTLKDFRADGLDVDDLGKYIYAMHAKDRNAQMGKNGIVDGSGISDNDADAIIDGYRRSGKLAKLESARKNFVHVLNDEFGLDYLHKAGLIDQQSVDRLEKAYGRDYVPLKDDITDEDGVDYGRVASVANPLLKARGRGSEAENPTAFMLMGALRNVTNAAENASREATAKFVEAHPEIGEVRLVKPTDRLGDDAITFRRNVMVDVVDANGKVTGQEEVNRRYVVELYGNRGKRVQRALTDADLVRGPQWLQGATRWFASFATQLSPTFSLRNWAKDTVEATLDTMATSGAGEAGKFLKGQFALFPLWNGEFRKTVREFKETGNVTGNSKMANYFREYVDSGALIGGGAREGYAKQMEDFREIGKKLGATREANRKAVAMWDAYKEAIGFVNESIEQLTRFNNFMRRREAGESVEKAAMNSREGSTDFGMYGNQRWMNSLWMFSNSILGGTMRGVKSMTVGKYGRALAAGMFTLGMMEEMADVAINGSEDERKRKGTGSGDDVTEYERENSLHLRIGDKVYRTPIHLGPWSVLKYAGSNMARVLSGKMSAEEALKNVSSSLATIASHFTGTGEKGFGKGSPSLANAMTPSILQPLVQVSMNENYKGDKIYTEHDLPGSKERPDWKYARRNTNKVFVEMSRLINKIPFTGGNDNRKGALDIPPESIEYLMKQLGKNFMTDMVNTFVETPSRIAKAVNGDEDAMELRTTPIVRDFVHKVPNVSSRYYEEEGRYEGDLREYKDMPARARAKFARSHYGMNGQLKELKKRIDEEAHAERGERKSGSTWVSVKMSDKSKKMHGDIKLRLMAKFLRLRENRG